MCGIVGFLDRSGVRKSPNGRTVLNMLQALACRGPDGAGIAMIRDEPAEGDGEAWTIRIAPAMDRTTLADRISKLGSLLRFEENAGGESIRFGFRPAPGVTADSLERALGANAGGLEVLSLGHRLDLVKQVGSPDQLEAAYKISAWSGPIAIGHTRMSTESRIDLSHSQPFWAHGVADLATVHNGHVTNYHRLRRRYEQAGVTFYTDNDSEVIGVYLREKLDQGLTLPEALTESIVDLDGAFNYLVASNEGLGVVRDRFGFKPLMLAEGEDFVALATEEVALRLALGNGDRVYEPPPGQALFFPAIAPEPALV
jgi:glutamate synthase domain-containing protein 1